jgi:hypothetical protein
MHNAASCLSTRRVGVTGRAGRRNRRRVLDNAARGVVGAVDCACGRPGVAIRPGGQAVARGAIAGQGSQQLRKHPPTATGSAVLLPPSSSRSSRAGALADGIRCARNLQATAHPIELAAAAASSSPSYDRPRPYPRTSLAIDLSPSSNGRERERGRITTSYRPSRQSRSGYN